MKTLNVIDSIRIIENAFDTNAPKQVEVFFDQCGKEKYLLQLLNLSGFNGTTVFEPIPISNIEITFNEIKPKHIYGLFADGKKELVEFDKVRIPVLNQYAAFLIEV